MRDLLQLFTPKRAALLGSPAFLTVLALPPSTVQAQRERPRLVLQALDLDHDGSLSAAELRNASAALLTLDRNGDGQLTADELEPPRPDAGMSADQLTTLLMGFDRNGDGVLSAEEVPERLKPMFTRGDRDHDGKLTAAEIRAMAQRTGAPNGHAGGPGSSTGVMRQDPLLNSLDADHDGVVSAAEITAAPVTLASLDKNGDGTLSPEEIRVRQPSPAERTAHLLDEFDTDKDGKLSSAEAPDGLRARFSAADLNHDGVLDREELLQMFAQQQSPGRSQPAQQKGTHD